MMTRTAHRIVRALFLVGAAVLVVGVLARHPHVALPPPPVTRVGVSPEVAPVAFTEPLFADPPPDIVPVGSASGPPQLLGIVGRLSDPLVMVRMADGAVRTIARGEAVGGWALASVASDRATFRRGAEERVAVLPVRDGP